MKRLSPTLPPLRYALLWLVLCCGGWLQAQIGQIYFIEDAPADTTVACFADLPPTQSLAAVRERLTGPDTFRVVSFDSLGTADAPCTGGSVFRIWRARGPINSIEQTQVISFAGAPPERGPTFDEAALPARRTVVDCRAVNDEGSDDNFARWLSTRRIAAASAARAGCAPLATVRDDAPFPVDDLACADSLTVAFVATDQCGHTDTVTFVYRTEDTFAPVFVGLASDTVVVSCADTLPAIPDFTVVDCDVDPVVTFTETSTQVVGDACREFSYDVRRTWTAVDRCGNVAVVRHLIEVRDVVAPDFTRPSNRDLECTRDPFDLNVTGRPFSLTDDCAAEEDLELTYTDEVVELGVCTQSFNVLRSWRLTDPCGNSRVKVQRIRVRDNGKPTFTPPPATVEVSCADYEDTNITGTPTNLFDGCDPSVNLSFEDDITPGDCPGNFTVEREWRVFDDCGNRRSFTQQLIVTDNTPPVRVTASEDLITSCNVGRTENFLFLEWVANLGGAEYTDGCTAREDLDIRIVAAGTNEYPSFPPISCADQDGVVRRLTVEIYVTDQCGNTTVNTMEYRQEDDQAVNIFDCPESRVIPTDPGQCSAEVFYAPPTILERCSVRDPLQLNLRDTVAITSAAANQAELGSVPVDPVTFRLVPPFDPPVNGFTTGILTITLENIDAEGSEEFFTVVGEDGFVLGQTALGDVQCSDVTTVLEIDPVRFTRYARDGTVEIRLEPNVPAGQPGTFAVNNLCPGGSRAIVHLLQSAYTLTPVTYEVDVDGTGFAEVDPVDTIFSRLDEGLHQITYRVTDCGGNVDECTFTYTIEDQEPPVVTCPPAVDVELAADSCQITLEMDLPPLVEDNCEPYAVEVVSQPAGGGLSFFPFANDPNLNSLQAEPVSFTLADAPGNLVDSVTLAVRFRGQFGNPGAILDVVLPDGSVLVSSARNDASCTAFGLLEASLSADRYRALAAGGPLTVTVRPRPVTVPPGQAGDGVTPCDEAAAQANGTDGISGAALTVTYRSLFPAFFTTGATVTGLQQTTDERPVPILTFNSGVTDFVYVVTDGGGNQDSCAFSVTVRDVTPPTAVCTATTVLVDPSGLAPTVLDPAVIGGQSFDNCGVADMVVSPDSFACGQYGETVNVQLTVTDPSGNQDSCTTVVSVAPELPQPTASTSVCNGDTLRLVANPPTVAQPGQTIYTFQWFAPDGSLLSTEENPVIPGIDESDEGAYRLVIRGLTGCEAEAVALIDIGNIPGPPVVTAPESVCTGEEVTLVSESTYVGQVRYEWYRGTPPNGTLLGETLTNSYEAAFAGGAVSNDFYAIVYVNGCASGPSEVVTVTRVSRPSVTLPTPLVEVCELGTFSIRAGGLNFLDYEWTGPDGFTFSGRTVVIESVQLDQAGTYTVRSVRNGGCFSTPVSVELDLRPADVGTSLLPVAAVCPSDTLELSAEDRSGSLYIFNGPNDLEFTSPTPDVRIAPVTPLVVGNWTVRIQRDDCPSAPSDPVEVRLGTAPVATAFTLPDPICVGNDLILQGSSNVAGSTYEWSGPNGYAASGIAIDFPDVDESVNGQYVLTVTSPTGCFARDTVDVAVLPGIKVDSINVLSGSCLIGGEPAQLFASVSPPDADYRYQWTGPEGTSTSDTFSIPSVSLASNGTYTLTVENEAGCVSPRFSMEIDFDFAPAQPATPFTMTGETSFCEGADVVLQTNDFGPGVTYLWQLPDGTRLPTPTNELTLDNIPSAYTGTFTVRVVRGDCTSLPSEGRTLTVTSFPTVTVTANDPACSGQPINFQATDLAGATYAWTGPGSFSSSLPDPTIVSADADVHAGTYTVVATRNGCSSQPVSVDVTVRPTPGVPVVMPFEPVCLSEPGASLSLTVNPNTATAGATYAWFIQNGQVPVGEPTTDLTLPVTDLGLFEGGGTFDFSVRASVDGCSSAVSSPFSVRLDAVDDFQPDAGRDTFICEGLFLLSASPGGAGTGRWSIVSGSGDIQIINPDSRTTAVQGLTQFGGPYEFAWTLSNGSCIDYAADTIMLTVTDGEEAVAGENFLACVREETFLNATPVSMSGSGGRWSQALAQELLDVVIVDPTDPNTEIRGLQADNIYSFTWTVTSNCGVKDEVVIVNVSDPSPFAGDDAVVCNDDRSAVLAADETTVGSEGRWLTPMADMTIADPESPTTMVVGLVPGDNLFVWEVDAGFCGDRSRDTVVITYVEPPLPQDDEYTVAFQEAVTFDPTENDDNPAGAVLTFGEVPMGAALTANPDGTFTFKAPANFVGELSVRYTVMSDGCTTADATVFFVVGDGVDCVPPNIFTPNGDGMNDRFVVPCLLDTDRFPDSQVTIYNQWGDEVFRSGRPYRSDWDGTFQGSPLPVATYFYTIDFGGTRAGASGSVRIER